MQSQLLILFVICLKTWSASAAWDYVPGVVIDHSPASSRTYLGSPSIAILPDGTYVATHDYFGPGAGQKSDCTDVFGSKDKGRTWHHIGEIKGQYWSSLFVHRGQLFLMGTSEPYGAVVIRRSTDGGRTWSRPKDPNSGLLLDDGPYHTAPVPVVEHHGRLWRAMEDAMGPGGWGSHFRSFVISAPANGDLLNARNWRCTNRLGRNPQWLGGNFGGWLEGNVVAGPGGQLVNILRVHYQPQGGKAAMVTISSDGRIASFDASQDFIDFPGGCKKFTIRYDPVSQQYWTLSNAVLPAHQGAYPSRIRNALTLMSSNDLLHWQIRCVVLYHPDVTKHGFQYADWQFEGKDLVSVIRTAFDDGLGGAHNQHDSNFIIFFRVPDFRNLQLADSADGAKPHQKAWQPAGDQPARSSANNLTSR